MDMGVKGYYEFLNISNYAAVRGAQTPLEYLQAIKAAGYATSINYVQNVYNVITKWNLTKYDNIQENKETTTNSSLFIIQKNGTHNTTVKNNRNIDYIVLHYTAGTSSAKGAAQNTASWFMNPSAGGSADFIVDDVDIVQYNPDVENRYCWAVGGNKYSNKINSLSGIYYGQCKNNNSISIEMCSKKRNTASLASTDNDWYLTELTVENAVKLTKYLMQKYHISINNVIMHNMVTGKWCPQPWTKNEDALQNWYNFLSQVKGCPVTTTTNNVDANNSQNPIIEGGVKTNYLVRISADVLNVRSGPGTLYSKTMQVKKGSVYTIVAEQNGFGKLKSGAGWISLDYVEKVNAETKAPEAAAYLVRVTADTLNVRQGPDTNYKIVTSVHRPSVYTIVEEQNGWGKLKSGVGYISLKYTEKI